MSTLRRIVGALLFAVVIAAGASRASAQSGSLFWLGSNPVGWDPEATTVTEEWVRVGQADISVWGETNFCDPIVVYTSTAFLERVLPTAAIHSEGFTLNYHTDEVDWYHGLGFQLPFAVEKRSGRWLAQAAERVTEVSVAGSERRTVWRYKLYEGGLLMINFDERGTSSPVEGRPSVYTIGITWNLNLETEEVEVVGLTYEDRNVRIRGSICHLQKRRVTHWQGRIQSGYSQNGLGQPASSKLVTLNPLTVPGTSPQQPPSAAQVVSAQPATRVAADGQSALLVMFQSDTPEHVTFSLSSTASSPFGSLSPYTPGALAVPSPTGQTQITLGPAFGCAPVARGCTFLALLWGPSSMIPLSPSSFGRADGVPVTVTAAQGTAPPSTTTAYVVPPPLVLVHGIWSSAKDSWRRMKEWLTPRYPHDVIVEVDYQDTAHLTFRAVATQREFLRGVSSAIQQANATGIAARSVDVVGHSMGGLVARQFLHCGQNPGACDPDQPAWPAYFTAQPIHKLISVGTPHLGSPLASTLWTYRIAPPAALAPLVQWECGASCTMEQFFESQGKKVDSAVDSLRAGLGPASGVGAAPDRRMIVGLAPSGSLTESLLNLIIKSYVPGATVAGMMGEPHDTIVPVSSQRGADAGATLVSVDGVVHANLMGNDSISETRFLCVWSQVAAWLLEQGPAGIDMNCLPVIESLAGAARAGSSMIGWDPLGVPDLSGYTEIPAAGEVTVTPADGSTVAVNRPLSIAVSATSRSLSHFIVMPSSAPSDPMLLMSTQAPFAVTFTPERAGTLQVTAVSVFTDMTYAVTTLTLSLDVGMPRNLTVLNAEEGLHVSVGSSITVRTEARIDLGGVLDVSSLSTYAPRGGSSPVFSVAAGGVVTGLAPGTDWLDVSYKGLSTAMPVTVGSCAVSLGRPSANIPAAGGSTVLQVTADPGCAWRVAVHDPWIDVVPTLGSGSALITVSAGAHAGANARWAALEVGSGRQRVAQVGTACTYTGQVAIFFGPEGGLSERGVGGSGTSCMEPPPLTTDASWIGVQPGNAPGLFFVSVRPNDAGGLRVGTVAVGDATVTVTQGAPVAPVVISHPESRSYMPGGKVTLVAAASADPAASVQWQVSQDGGQTWQDIVGGYSPTLVVAPGPGDSGTWYRAIFSNAGGFAVTQAATISEVNVGANVVGNGSFSQGLGAWQTYATPDPGYINAAVVDGVLEFTRVTPPPGTTNQATVFQTTGLTLDARAALSAQFDLGNSSTVRKRISVLLIDADFSDLAVCTFWLPAQSPLRTYTMRTHTTKTWANAAIYFYAATAGADGGAYLLDNVIVQPDPPNAADRTECLDPLAPVPQAGPDGPELLVNGDFSEANAAGWTTFGNMLWWASDVFRFYQSSPSLPMGVVLQPTGTALGAGKIITARLDLGNSSSVRKRVTVLLHDLDFSDLHACTFWIEPGQPLSPYAMRTFATRPWANVTLSVYVATIGPELWIELDNVSLKSTPQAAVSGTDCLEPVAPPDRALPAIPNRIQPMQRPDHRPVAHDGGRRHREIITRSRSLADHS